MTTDHSRVWFWSGLGVVVLGVALTVAQFQGLKYLATPWYLPALATAGAALLLAAAWRRWSVVRGVTFVAVAALAGLLWFFFGVLAKLPDYDGPARAGSAMPAFRAALADGRPFTDADLRDGSHRAMVFFRGRW